MEELENSKTKGQNHCVASGGASVVRHHSISCMTRACQTDDPVLGFESSFKVNELDDVDGIVIYILGIAPKIPDESSA